MAVKHLRLSKYRGIDSITLLNLDRINVVCGKNNSGKSSILEAIASPTSCEPGVTVSDEAIQKLSALLASAVDLAFEHPRGPAELLVELLRLTFDDGEVWFPSASGELF